MKLHIDVELSPEEIPLATELFNILRQLSAKVQTKNLPQLFRSLVSRLQDADALDAVSADINALLTEDNNPQTFDDFFDAFTEVVFNPDLVTSNVSVVPFFGILPRLVDAFKGKMRERLFGKVLKFLAIKRSVDCNRMEFFAYAEAFAAMVKLEFAPISGAVTTITTLITKLETRCAGVTMLGKTVELCLNLLNEKCEPAKLLELRQSLKNVTEEAFRYDLSYIEDNMIWPGSSDGYSATASSALNGLDVGLTLQATSSYIGHQTTIFAICYDEVRDQVISSCKDGYIVTWDANGKEKNRLVLPKHYACSMDINPRHNSLFVSGVAKDGPNPAIIGYTVDAKGNWTSRGAADKDNVKLVSCVKALVQDQGNNFVTGESSKNPSEPGGRVRFYDASSVASFDKLQPLTTYEEHTDIVTTLTHCPNHDGRFFSGSRDCTVKLWDRRQAKSVGTFGYQQPGLNMRMAAHDSMITCLSAFDTLLVSGSLDKSVVVWDIRNMDATSFTTPLIKFAVDDTAILKVAIGPDSNHCAVSTLNGLHLIDFSTGKITQATPFADGRPMRRYHDLKWNAARGVLYAAGDDARVDKFTLARS
eukprot:TRINITY_DN18925_c0_g1_i1.p1 TRINITY_DN18925_c0_g1~~TRINITY_DN18925_c0_g1_i1.p1  ORF type:complete len:615 (-),score=130.08 TRINITY_DN18925_c0_g1_i1:233-2002(-)